MHRDDRLIALTFDDGPHPQTCEILDLLRAHGAKATFFTTGSAVEKHPEILREAIAQGHEIATHTGSHPHLSELPPAEIAAEIQRGLDAVAAVDPAVKVHFLRPPYGDLNETVCACCRERGLLVALWTYNPDDWRGDGTAVLVDRLLGNLRDGSAVVCHDWQPQTAEALRVVLPALVAQGFRMVTLSALKDRDAPGAKPGDIFPRADGH